MQAVFLASLVPELKEGLLEKADIHVLFKFQRDPKSRMHQLCVTHSDGSTLFAPNSADVHFLIKPLDGPLCSSSIPLLSPFNYFIGSVSIWRDCTTSRTATRTGRTLLKETGLSIPMCSSKSCFTILALVCPQPLPSSRSLFISCEYLQWMQITKICFGRKKSGLLLLRLRGKQGHPSALVPPAPFPDRQGFPLLTHPFGQQWRLQMRIYETKGEKLQDPSQACFRPSLPSAPPPLRLLCVDLGFPSSARSNVTDVHPVRVRATHRHEGWVERRRRGCEPSQKKCFRSCASQFLHFHRRIWHWNLAWSGMRTVDYSFEFKVRPKKAR